MAPTLYIVHASPPVRAVLITAKAIGLELNLKEINFFEGEHKSPEYLKINPLHTFPTLVEDNGFIVSDSHAINAYLVSKYAKNDYLYPKDLEKRAIVDQRLHFDCGVLFPRILKICKPIAYGIRNEMYEEDINDLLEAIGFLKKLLEGNEWMAGDFISLADYSLLPSVGSISTIIPISEAKHPNVTAWLKRVRSRPETEVNQRGENDFAALFKTKLGIQ